ncbi:hypothetical protein [Microbacterium suwonense]|uniref:Leucine rich repeat variant domain-containing protein n=1 Tax=Microbacterium suwonense TaxID=683047 RepID=A0ABN6X4G4_9MICO|nr:hypothetical protein [Microbacterium suwonense]BDZ39614.1 hypothetical protein GCM10025863_22280 [Microbacterium suwonense]
MTDTADREVLDPSTSAERLAQIAASRPDLAPMIARHPNAYPELVTWAQQTAGVIVAQPGAPIAPTAPSAERKPLLRRRGVIIGASITAAALVLGGGAFAAVRVITGGASSPEAAAQRLVDGTLGGDVLALAGTFAPSEARYLQPLLEHASKLQAPALEEGDVDYVELLSQLKDTVKVTLDGFQYEATEIAEGIQVVTLVDGTVTIDGDPEQVADALVELAYANPAYRKDIEGSYDGDSHFGNERSSMIEGLRKQLPIIWDIGDFNDDFEQRYDFERQSPLSVVVVDEGGWYVSPLLTGAELVYSQALVPAVRYDDRRLPLERGDDVIDANPAKSPESALQALADGAGDAFATGDVDALAAALPLPERRLLSIYGEAFFADAANQSSLGQDRRLDFPRLNVKSEEVDGGVQLTAKQVDMEYFALRETSGSVQFTRNCVLPDFGSRFCLDDQPVLGRLGLKTFHVIATQENGGWVINPLATISRQGQAMIDGYAEYLREDKLDKLFDVD